MADTGLTFEESLHQHLAALQSVLLQEHQKLVAQIVDSNECKAEALPANQDIQLGQRQDACNSNGDAQSRREPPELNLDSPAEGTGALKSKEPLPSPSAPASPLMARITEQSQLISRKTAQIFGVYNSTTAERFAEMAGQQSEQTPGEIQSGWPDHMGGKLKRPRQFIASDIFVEILSDLIVTSNVVLIGFQTGSTWHGWFTVDCVYAALFILEIMLRLRIHGFSVFKRSSPEFKWMMFDIVLASLSVFDIISSRLDTTSGGESTNYTWLRIARLVRIARILRLLKLDFLKDLVLVIDGAVGGLRTLAWSMLIIVLPLYVFALFFTEMIGSQEPDPHDDVVQLFSGVGVSMFTGFRCLVEGDCSTMSGTPIFPHMVSKYGWMYGVVYSFMSLFMSFGLFNVIIAIYVENTVNAAKSNEVLQRQRRLEDESRFAEKLLNLIQFLWNDQYQVDEEHDFDLDRALRMHIDGDQFRSLVERPAMRDLLGELDVPKEDHKDLFEICDADGSGFVSMAELVAGVRRLRGEPRRSDLVYVMLRINRLLAEVRGYTSPSGGGFSPASQRKSPKTPVAQRMSPVSRGGLMHRRPKPCPITTVSADATSPVQLTSTGGLLEL